MLFLVKLQHALNSDSSFQISKLSTLFYNEQLEFRAAAMARRKLVTGRVQLWGHPIAVDWAEPEEDVDDDVMQSVKVIRTTVALKIELQVLYVRNLLIETNEDVLRAHFATFGKVERVKKIRDYAFVHYEERESAVRAVEAGEQQFIDGKLPANHLKSKLFLHFSLEIILISFHFNQTLRN